MEKLNFQIITPERVVFSANVDQVTMMTKQGEITVLPNHVPLVTILKPGELRFKQGDQEDSMAVSGGFAEVRDAGNLVILADTAERAEEIDIVRAEEARDRAKQMMSEARRVEGVDYAALRSKLEKELARLRVGNKYRKLPRKQ